MFRSIDSVSGAVGCVQAEPRSLGELLPEVLARYGIAAPASPEKPEPVAVHAAHAKRARRHPGPQRSDAPRETRERSDRPKAIRLPSAKRRLSAAG
jgi:hypothetical protein